MTSKMPVADGMELDDGGSAADALPGPGEPAASRRLTVDSGELSRA